MHEFRLFWNFGAVQTSIKSILWTVRSELGRHGQEFGHELVPESVSKADSNMRFSETSDTDLDKVSTSDMGSDTDLDTHKTYFVHPSRLGHGFGPTLRSISYRISPSAIFIVIERQLSS